MKVKFYTAEGAHLSLFVNAVSLDTECREPSFCSLLMPLYAVRTNKQTNKGGEKSQKLLEGQG